MSTFFAAAQDEDGDNLARLQARVSDLELSRKWGISEMQSRIADLEAQLYAVGAGGVGSPVARPDHPEQHLDMVPPQGWQLVPVEPTKEMKGAGAKAVLKRNSRSFSPISEHIPADEFSIESYRAMLTAAPQPPSVKDSLTPEQPQDEQKLDAFYEWWHMRPSLTRLQAWLLWKDEQEQLERAHKIGGEE
jgi:hypothetical protein